MKDWKAKLESAYSFMLKYSKLESKTFGLVLELEMWRDRSVATSGIAWRPLGISFLFEVIA